MARDGSARSGSEAAARKFLRGAGWTFIALGCFVLYFLVYQLWGTNLTTNREQSNLRASLQREWSGSTPSPKKDATATLPVPKPPALGKALGVLEIPKIRLEKIVVQGANPAQLAKGPGHVQSTVMPGQPGTFAISGHRTTHGAPFYRLNELAKGDTITIVTRYAIYTYKVSRLQIVAPTAVEVLDNVRASDGTLRSQIVLTTCNPRFSASQRLVVFGDLVRSAPNTGGELAA
ncbi:MAG TPA: class E sortase [Actinomycetes bacterium]|jgi:sortase A|nr:class E sortase [Actinomycetes bacterium]